MSNIAEKILISCGIGQGSALELVALVREDRLFAAWELFLIIEPDPAKREKIIKKACRLFIKYKLLGKSDDTCNLVEKCFTYLRKSK
jgi:hypothetical protein